MAFFQHSVLKKQLLKQDAKSMQSLYSKFQAHFHNPEIQQNIRASKEEQYQEGFLRDLFVDILGYTLNPTPEFNLTTEYKNVKDSKKADGAIVVDKSVRAVIELKGTDTTDLDKIEPQAFGYKNNQPECTYIIISNFEKLRFYIDNAIDHIEFNLFTLTEIEFELLWLCLAYENIVTDLPKKIKNASVSEEDTITKNLYKDYSLFKRELHQNLVALNPDIDELLLFKKSQKLLDRFLFLFFAEDRQLLPPNSVRVILDQWNKLKDMDAYFPLYSRFKTYFGYLNTGYKGKQYDVFAYNGGLFKPDDILDAVEIDDDLLYRHTLKLSDYDFASEVDVNILGHIFENSLNELDEIKAQLSGEEVDKTKTKRKKDGVFYTPKYITKYIVDNTVGKLCAEKQAELDLKEEDYITDKKQNKNTKKHLYEKLTAYRDWLLQITICDPACGSGAFLNQALDFLIQEHRYIDELQAKLFGDTLVLSDVEKSILENNLFGVDINEESVEIAKLALWLRTAQPNRKLNDLSNNIKCGNSLIDDPAVAGDKAFDWKKEFPQVYRKKVKKAWHITTATHNSRYSQRMYDHYVKLGEPVWLTPQDEIIVTQTIAEIVEADNLNVLAYNICGDHMHIALVCEEDEVPKIVGKLKSMSARAANIASGRTETWGHAPVASGHAPMARGETQTPMWTQKYGCTEITSEEQLYNTIAYIRNNRRKHGLPEFGNKGAIVDTNKGACPLGNYTNTGTIDGAIDGTIYGTNTGAIDGTIYDTNTGTIDDTNKGACPLVDNTCGSTSGETTGIYPRTKTPAEAFRPEYTGGFDVVIGNPPYVFARDNFQQKEKNFFIQKYLSAKYQINTYLLFIEKSVDLIKHRGVYGLIIPNSWLMTYSGEGLRKLLLGSCKLNQIINLKGYSFENANVETVILLAEKSAVKEDSFIDIFLNDGCEFIKSHNKNQLDFYKSDGFEFKVFLNDTNEELNQKLLRSTETLDSLVDIKAGLQAYEKGKGEPLQSAEDVINRPYDYNYKYDEDTFKYLEGKDVGRYFINWSGLYLRYGKHLAAPRTFSLFNGQKVIVREITGTYPKCIISTYSEDLYLYNRSNIAILKKEGSLISLKYVVALINSSLLSYYFINNTAKSVRKLFPKIILNDLRKFPIKNISQIEQLPFIAKTDEMISFNSFLSEINQKFQRMLQRKFELEELPGKLQNWYLLSYKEFIAELGKKKVKLTLAQEAEWEDYFSAEQAKALEIKNQIDSTDREIDRMVYELYGLTEEEIKIVEGEK